MAAALGGAPVLATDKTGNRYCKPVVDAHGDDLRGRLGGDAQDVYPAAGVFDDEERVEPVQGDRVEMEQVAGEGRRGPGAEELHQVGRRGIDPRRIEDRPHGGGADLVAESGEFAVYASMSPGGILSGQIHDECADASGGPW